MNTIAEVPPASVLPSVYLLADAFPVLSQTFVLELAAGLRAKKVPLRILATDTENTDLSLLDGHPAGADLAARMVQPRANAREIGAFLAQRTARGKPPVRILLRAVAKPHQAKALLGRAAAFAQCPPVDVLHCQFATLGVAALRFRNMKLLRFRKLVVHLRGWDITMYTAQNGPEALHSLFAQADLFIAACQHFADLVIEMGCDPARVVVIGSPIDTDRFSPPSVPRKPATSLRIGAVGRLVEKKGFDDLIEAMAVLRDKGIAARLEIIGEGPMRPTLEGLIHQHDLANTVQLHGAAAPDNVRALMHRVDTFVTPSKRAASGDEDGVVNSLKEAMATGLPVIGTQHGGIPEVIDDGINGLLVPERAPLELAEAIAQIAATPPEIRADMGRAGWRKVVSEYSGQAIASKTVQAYVKLVQSDQPG